MQGWSGKFPSSVGGADAFHIAIAARSTISSVISLTGAGVVSRVDVVLSA